MSSSRNVLKTNPIHASFPTLNHLKQPDVDKELIEYLISKIDADVKDDKDNNLLHIFLKLRKLEYIPSLLLKGTDVHAKNKHKENALDLAIQLNHSATFTMLFAHYEKENANCYENMLFKVMHVLARKTYTFTDILLEIAESIQILSLLKKNGADFNAKSKEGNTLLNLTILFMDEIGFTQRTAKEQNENLNLFHFFLKQGADPQLADDDGNSPIHTAAKCAYTSIFYELLSLGANPNIANKHGLTAQTLLDTALATKHKDSELESQISTVQIAELICQRENLYHAKDMREKNTEHVYYYKSLTL